MFRVWLSLDAAERGRETLQPCVEVESSAAGVDVRCPFDAHALGSDELGFGPYTGQTWIITVRDGEIVGARMEWNNIEHMIQEVVEPFGQWVQANHPDDFAVMYIDGNPTDFQLTQGAVRLWEQHLGEYIASQTNGARRRRDVHGRVGQCGMSTRATPSKQPAGHGRASSTSTLGGVHHPIKTGECNLGMSSRSNDWGFNRPPTPTGWRATWSRYSSALIRLLSRSCP